MNQASFIIERMGQSSDNSLVAILNRVESSGLIELNSLPCWCITVVPENQQHMGWCLKLRSGFKEFHDYVNANHAKSRENPVVTSKDDYSHGRGAW
jgi:hypothetical protein